MVYESYSELAHYGVLGMKWGKRKAKYDSARASYRKASDNRSISKTKADKKTNSAAVKAAKAEMRKAKKEYKEATELTKSQKRVRLGATAAATVLLSPVGGLTVAALTTSHYRGKNDIDRD